MDMREPIITNTMQADIRGEVRYDEPMSRHVSWRAGGRAKRFFKPADLEDLCSYLPTLPADEAILFVGLGSNLLVRGSETAGGFDGTVILTTPGLGGIALDQQHADIVVAGAGAASPHVAKFAAKSGLAGAEWLAGVPGTVGGALAMNAGCYGTETWDQIVDCQTVDRQGHLQTRCPEDFEISYRHVMAKTAVTDEFFVSARFRFAPGDAAIAQGKIKELLAKRMAAQPLDKPNAGSTFRNPSGDHAARLIESCGLKGFAIGGAQVSQKHANFIINTGSASAHDIESLIDHMQQVVVKQTGVTLAREVRIVGAYK
jgi:UDP-N-acetylmuramate dehydrogenase